MRLIDADRLNEVIERNFCYPGCLKQIVDAQPTAYDVDKQWIPCSERLPEESLESVIGWDEYRERCCFVQYYRGQWILGNSNASVKIVAWMPLPNPYKEQDS